MVETIHLMQYSYCKFIPDIVIIVSNRRNFDVVVQAVRNLRT